MITKQCLNCMEIYEETREKCPVCGYAEGTPPEEGDLIPGRILQNRYIVGTRKGIGNTDVTYIGWDALFERKVLIQEFFPRLISGRKEDNRIVPFSGKDEAFQKGVLRFYFDRRELIRLYRQKDIVTVYSVFRENGTAYATMQYADSLTLREYAAGRNGLEFGRALKLLYRAVEAVRKVHAMGLIHGALSGDSFWINASGTGLVLKDFAEPCHMVGDPSLPDYGSEGAWTDVTGLAMLFAELLNGEPPQNNKSALRTFSGIRKQLSDRMWETLSKSLSDEKKNRILTLQEFYDGMFEEGATVEVWKREERIRKGRRKMRIVSMAVGGMLLFLLLTGIILFTVRRRNAESEATSGNAVTTATEESGEASSPAESAEESSTVENDEKPAKEDSSEEPVTTEIPASTPALAASLAPVKEEARKPSLMEPAETIPPAQAQTRPANNEENLFGLGFGARRPDRTKETQEETQQETAGGAQVAAGMVGQIDSGYFKVPSVTYKDESDAVSEIKKNCNLTPEINYGFSEEENKGRVIKQSISAGALIQETDKIVLTVGRGPLEEVPDVVGLDWKEASILLREAGLITMFSGEYTSRDKMGKVLSQKVKENEDDVDEKTKEKPVIMLSYSIGPEMVKVPGVREKTKAEAITVLEGLGFQVESESKYSDVYKSGLICDQSIDPGKFVDKGSTITITESLGKKPRETSARPRETTAAETTAAQTTAAQTTAAQTTSAETAAAETTAAETTAAETAAAETAAPETAAAETETAAAETAAAETETTAPETAAPENAAPGQAMPTSATVVPAPPVTTAPQTPENLNGVVHANSGSSTDQPSGGPEPDTAENDFQDDSYSNSDG